MILPFHDGLFRATRADVESALLADRHYSRRTKGSAQFTGPGSDIVLRNADASVLFVWVWHNRDGVQLERWDKQEGYCCSLFRNESPRRSSEIIREAEVAALEEWGPNRAYTYVDPLKVTPTMMRGRPTWGHCFYQAGWSFVSVSSGGLHLLEKQITPKPLTAHEEPTR